MYSFVLFFAYPVLELWLLFKFASTMGFWNAFFITTLVSAIGLGLIFSQSQQILTDIASDKHIDFNYLINSATKTFSGILIALPGFITLILGLLLLLPWTKKRLIKFFTRFFHIHARDYRTENYAPFEQNTNELGKGRIIEGQIVNEEKHAKK